MDTGHGQSGGSFRKNRSLLKWVPVMDHESCMGDVDCWILQTLLRWPKWNEASRTFPSGREKTWSSCGTKTPFIPRAPWPGSRRGRGSTLTTTSNAPSGCTPRRQSTLGSSAKGHLPTSIQTSQGESPPYFLPGGLNVEILHSTHVYALILLCHDSCLMFELEVKTR